MASMNGREDRTGSGAFPRLRGCSWPSPTACHLLDGHLASTVIAEISLLRPAAGVVEVDPHSCAFPFFNFFAAVITDKDRLGHHLVL